MFMFFNTTSMTYLSYYYNYFRLIGYIILSIRLLTNLVLESTVKNITNMKTIPLLVLIKRAFYCSRWYLNKKKS